MTMPLPPFSLEQPTTLEALVALASQPDSRILAGGTDLLPSMKHRIFEPKTLISIRKVPELHGIACLEDGVDIGAACTLDEIRRHPTIQQRYPALRHACSTVATSTLQGMATLGGNLMLDTRCIFYNQPQGWRTAIGGCLKCEGQTCHVVMTEKTCFAAHSADTVPVLWLAGATVTLASSTGSRIVAVRDLFEHEPDGRKWLAIQPGEVLTRVYLPNPAASIAYRKVRVRGAIDYGVLLVACQKWKGGARAVIGATGPKPIEVQTSNVEDLPEAAWRAVQPLNTHSTSTTWRKAMIRVMVRRVLAELE